LPLRPSKSLPGKLSTSTIGTTDRTDSLYKSLTITRCFEPVFIYQSNNGGCDSGPNGICSTDPGAAPFVIPAGNAVGNQIIDLGLVANGFGTSVKISKDTAFDQGILQFEYTVDQGVDPGIYWDISNLDGAGDGLVGTPFANDNVKVSPTGDGSNANTCNQIRCPAGQVCAGAFLASDQDAKVHFCPLDTGIMWLDLCEPGAQFNSRRAIAFNA